MIRIRPLTPFSRPHHSLYRIGERLRGKTIYKYMPIETALLCLQNNTLRFSTPDVWKDPFEKYYYTADYSHVMPIPPFETKIFACCLTKNPDCEAAWRMYTDDAENNPCVQFKIYPGQFRSHVEKFVKENNACLYEGCVNYDLKDSEILHLYQHDNPNYQPVFENFSLENYLNLMILKRGFYKYEEEVRYMIQGEGLNYENGHIDVIIPWSLCLYSIQLPPNCPLLLKERLNDALQNNFNRCVREYPGYFPQIAPQVENSLYAPLTPIIVE